MDLELLSKKTCYLISFFIGLNFLFSPDNYLLDFQTVEKFNFLEAKEILKITGVSFIVLSVLILLLEKRSLELALLFVASLLSATVYNPLFIGLTTRSMINISFIGMISLQRKNSKKSQSSKKYE